MAVTPANAGVQKWLISLDSRVRGNDENGSFLTFYEFVNLHSRKAQIDDPQSFHLIFYVAASVPFP